MSEREREDRKEGPVWEDLLCGIAIELFVSVVLVCDRWGVEVRRLGGVTREQRARGEVGRGEGAEVRVGVVGTESIGGTLTGGEARGWFVVVVGGGISLEGGETAAVVEVGARGCWSAFFLRCVCLDGVAGVVIGGWKGWAG